MIGGNIASTAVGVTAFRYVPNPIVAAGVAVGVAIWVMSLLRCLHPPGGAAALTAVIGSAAIHQAGYWIVLFPIAVNSAALVVVALGLHRLVTNRSYPHRSNQDAVAPAWPGLQSSDIDAALSEMHVGFDIDREDLSAILAFAEQHAAARRMDESPVPVRRKRKALYPILEDQRPSEVIE